MREGTGGGQIKGGREEKRKADLVEASGQKPMKMVQTRFPTCWGVNHKDFTFCHITFNVY